MWNSFSLIAVLLRAQSRWQNGWKVQAQSIWQNVNYRRFAVALLLSVLLHLLFISQLFVDFINHPAERSVIEARLVLPVSALEKQALAPRALVKAAHQESPVKPVLPAPVENKTLPTSIVEPKIVEPTISVTAPTEPIPIDQAELPSITDNSAQAETVKEAENTDLIINQQAYIYVETDFDVRTEITENVNASAAGKAKIVYQLLPNHTQYQLKSLIQAKGLASLLIPDLLQTSEGNVGNEGLQPERYLYQFGDKANKTFSAHFDWRNQQLNLHSASGNQTLELAKGTQDLLSFMYQFMFVAPMQNMRLSITNGKKIGTYDYAFEGEETIDTKMGKLNTIHLMRMAAEGEKKTELWLALDYQYVPVKIRETEKQGKVYELLVSSLKTEMPTQAKPVSQ